MRDTIREELDKIEDSHAVRVLFACESGSRAWGFASPDSDYDVRFVYVNEPLWYLRLQGGRDVLEWCLDETLDINGWDLAKFLRLMHKSNPSVFEWLGSPIPYAEAPCFAGIRALAGPSFQRKPGLYHYLHMASTNYREFLQGELVRVKKYFYVIRPLLAARWVLHTGTPAPMLFEELVEAELDEGLQPCIHELLEEKAQVSELGVRSRIPELNAWIEAQLAGLPAQVDALPKGKDPEWDTYNEAFLGILRDVYGM